MKTMAIGNILFYYLLSIAVMEISLLKNEGSNPPIALLIHATGYDYIIKNLNERRKK